jgi:cytoskeletal protein RodZ
MPTVAEQLRAGREALKLDVQQVVEATKLKADQVRALEQGNYNSFTATVYLRGSVRTYATLLKLDVPKLLAQLDTELSSSDKFSDQLPSAPRKQSGVDSLMLLLSRNWTIAAVVVAIALLALGGTALYRAWQHRKTSDPLKGLGAGVYQPTGQSGETLPIPGTTNIKR